MSEVFRDSQWDRHGVIHGMLSKTKLPRMAKVKQLFDDNRIEDLPLAVRTEFDKKDIGSQVKEGASIAITVGSRGIANIAVITREIVANVKRLGGNPFIVPAMGSHGGATAEGQKEYVEGLGVTEEFVGAPIVSSMETVQIGTTSDGKPVHIDANAAKADGIIVSGRIKPHTAFRGEYESGLYKMMTIGLGKQKGAEICHEEGFGCMAVNVREFAEIINEKAPVLFGMAILENAYDETYLIEAVPSKQIKGREPVLLERAKSLMPAIKIKDIDVLIVDRIGKNFSGDGMDPNITASYCTPYASGGPEVKRYVVLDLSEETHGNAIGAGMADFGTKRMFDKMDFDAAYPNALTCTVIKGARIPLILKNDETAVKAAIFSCVNADKKNPRIVRICNSSHIDEVYVSEALKEEVMSHQEITLLEDFNAFQFDDSGNTNYEKDW